MGRGAGILPAKKGREPERMESQSRQAGSLPHGRFSAAIANLTRRQYDWGMDRETKEEPTTADLGDVTLDLDRQRRCGFPEVIFGEHKSVETLSATVRRLLAAEQPVLATRVDATKGAALSREFPAGRYNGVARTFRVGSVRRAEPGT